MRIYLHLTANTDIVPFNYQQYLVGAFHKWLGENELHDDISLYSLSWLSGGKKVRQGLIFPEGAEFFISSPLKDLHTKLIQGVFDGAYINWGMSVESVTMRVTPEFGRKHRFIAQSPIFIQRHIKGRKHAKYYFPSDPEANDYLTETLRHKLERMVLPTEVSVAFDPEYHSAHPKKVNFHGIDLRAAYHPVIVEGHPRAVQAAWEMGVGNSTGVGFGALR